MKYPVKAELVGADELKREFGALEFRARAVARDVINASSLRIMNRAKQLCVVDQGRLRASIAHSTYNDGLTAEVSTNVGYAAFIEFGTGPRGRQGHLFGGPLPPGYMHGGPGKPVPLDIILQWMRRHGIRPRGASRSGKGYAAAERGLAFVIARAINRRGQAARPFMFPAYFEEVPKFEAEMKRFGVRLGGGA
jgi:hypothetical protein